jgi:putative endonuclease
MPPPSRIPSRDWTDPRHLLGLAGEESAIAFLSAHGWSVEAHRFRLGHIELDLVVRRGALVAFVEVKTRRGGAFGPGREAIGWRKRLALSRVAEAWRHRYGRPGDVYRFDVIEVVPRRDGQPVVVHVEDAWRLNR